MVVNIENLRKEKDTEKLKLKDQLIRYRNYVLDGQEYFDKMLAHTAIRLYNGEF